VNDTLTPSPRRFRSLRTYLGRWPCYLGWHWGDFCWFCYTRVRFPKDWTLEDIAAYKEHGRVTRITGEKP
jgi:hypothetical protein